MSQVDKFLYVYFSVYFLYLYKNFKKISAWDVPGRYFFFHVYTSIKNTRRRLAVRTAHNFWWTRQSTGCCWVAMPRSKGKQNYKVDLLIQVVEEKLPNGAQGWQEVAFLYQQWSGELVLRDYEDVKRHWVDKCCNRFKKPTGNPGDPRGTWSCVASGFKSESWRSLTPLLWE